MRDSLIYGEISDVVSFAVLLSCPPNVSVQVPAPIFAQLLPCPHQVVSIYNATIPGTPGHILNPTVSEALGLPPWTPAVHRQMEEKTAENNVALKEEKGGRERKLVSLDISRGHRGGLVEMDGLFDISVLCTVYTDLQKLFGDGKDTRLVDALLWNAKVSYQQHEHGRERFGVVHASMPCICSETTHLLYQKRP